MTGALPVPLVAPQQVIPAAGALPWRRRKGRLEILLVHRPRYDDWSWAKGKLDPGEDWPAAAVREVFEETGLRVRLGRPLPCSAYLVLSRTGEPATKVTHYWAAEVVDGDGRLENEIDEVRWLEVGPASDLLTYARDRDQLRALVRAEHTGRLATWPLVVIRHAKARPRSSWSGADARRPLDSAGKRRAAELVPLLAAYAPARLVSSPSLRCTDTLAPYAARNGVRVRLREELSEESYEKRPDLALRCLERVLARGAAAAVCSHGPVLPELLDHLRARVADTDDMDTDGTALLRDAARSGIDKGEVLVAHLAGRGADATVVAVERHEV
ncbi:MAG TPA: NUDIX hydrolase [Dermatophilaceae bacterium]|nr:NUDIX hydrolase [Dermatophilaceae bacterium]